MNHSRGPAELSLEDKHVPEEGKIS